MPSAPYQRVGSQSSFMTNLEILAVVGYLLYHRGKVKSEDPGGDTRENLDNLRMLFCVVASNRSAEDRSKEQIEYEAASKAFKSHGWLDHADVVLGPGEASPNFWNGLLRVRIFDATDEQLKKSPNLPFAFGLI